MIGPIPGNGGIRGGGNGPNPPPDGNQGLMDMAEAAWNCFANFLRDLHDLNFQCVPVQPRPTHPRNDQLGFFLDKWFPSTVQFVVGDSHEIMIQQLEELEGEKFKVIVEAFNADRAEGQRIDEATTPEVFINQYLLQQDIVLKSSFFENHQELIRPYGLHKDNLRNDIRCLHHEVRAALRRLVDEGSTLEDYFAQNMGQLKEMLEAFRDN